MHRLALPLIAAASLAACNQQKAPQAAPATLSISDIVVRLPAVEGRPAAAYFTVNGGPKPDRLVAVSSQRAASIELHQSSMKGGVMRMSALTGVDVPEKGTISFKSGGRHAMLFGIDPTVKPGDRIALHFIFQSGATLDADGRAIAAGDDAASAQENHGH